VTAIPAGFAKTGKLTKSEKCLMGAGRHRLQTLGWFSAELQYDDKQINQMVYVVDGLRKPLPPFTFRH